MVMVTHPGEAVLARKLKVFHSLLNRLPPVWITTALGATMVGLFQPMVR